MSTKPPIKKPRTPEQILEYLNNNTIKMPGECWAFMGKPYGSTGHCKVGFNGKKVMLHRLSAHIHWGFDLDSPTLILHKPLCFLPNCWNPEHLYEGTKKDNAQDSILVGTFHFTEVTTHCPQGHEYTPENTAINSTSGKKYCKECNRQRAKRNYARSI